MKIHAITAREILDSRGNPTVICEVELADGTIAEASVPSGASKGSREAFELRDGIKSRFGGKGVLLAVSHVNEIIGPALIGALSDDQRAIDQKLLEIDGTTDKSLLGANAICAVSLAVAKAEAVSRGWELFEYLSFLFWGQKQQKYTLPTPMFNILNGGVHAQNNIDIQETLIVPVGFKRFEEKLRAGAEIYQVLKSALAARGFFTGLGDEGGFAPDFDKNESVLKWADESIAKANYSRKKVSLSLDVAASELFDSKAQKYLLKADKKRLDSEEMIKYLKSLAIKYQLLSVEDGLSENDGNWVMLTQDLLPTITIGDDLYTTNPAKIEEGIAGGLSGGVIIKPNQIGTLSETLEAIRVAQRGGLKIVISHRSGETEETFIADLAVAVRAEFIKSGAPARSERLAKYNRLTKIEDLIEEYYP